MAYRKVNDNSLASVADAIRSKGGTSDALVFPDGFVSAISAIQTGGGGAKETWVIKSDAAGEFATTQISFTSNGQKFTSIGANSTDSRFVLYYGNEEVAGYDIAGGGGVYEFDNEAYRKLTFDTPPTGALLTWLQSNAVKQPDDTAVQDTKALTITSNGTVSVTPDAPYDGLGSVDVTVNVASGGGGGAGFSMTFPATASNWGKLSIGGIIQADGTVINMGNYSTLAGKTIPNVVEIFAMGGGGYYLMVMTVQTGKIMITNADNISIDTFIASDGESSMTWIGNGLYARWIPLKDTVISAIGMYNTD